jgi:DNA invertase Pin-like site-specific DNA recombinase
MIMTKVSYARASSIEQSLDLQIAALKAANCDVIRCEKRSGTSTQGRDELRTILDFIRAVDVLTVTRIDRLARSIGDLQDIVRELKAKGTTLKATERPIDTSSAAGKAFLDMLGVFAEFETDLRRERLGRHRNRQASQGRAGLLSIACWRRESQFVNRGPRGGRSTLEPPGNLGHGVGAGLCCMWRMCSAEALALSLLMFARCRIWLLCDPVGAVALAAGAV